MIELSQKEFDSIREYTYKISGIAIPDEKRYLVRQRLEPLLREVGMKSYSELCEKIHTARSGPLRDALVSAITTNETFFFRDIHPFVSFEKIILPELGKMVRERKNKGGARQRTKLWCAASSTGQEPYSLAMLTSEYVQANSFAGISSDDFHILASDISPQVLVKAKSGHYTETELSRGLDQSRRNKYFKAAPGGWKLDDSVRQMVEFRIVNLIESFVFLGQFDVIFCRNVLIYFDTQTKKKILEKFRAILTPGGVLFLGSSETLYNLSDGFVSERTGSSVFYRKK